MKTHVTKISVDQLGHLIIPEELMTKLGIIPGSSIRIEEHTNSINIGHSATSLAKVYIEPTNTCNLDCRTCMRNVWEEKPGFMSGQTFTRVMEDASQLTPKPSLFFGGFGEPLAHPDILEMVSDAKNRGFEVELITNGILLTETVIDKLIQLRLDRIWVSIDGATPQSYMDVRLGDALPNVLNNLTRLLEKKIWAGKSRPRLGIAFVAMKRNIADLPEVIRIGKRFHADQFSISNVYPHTPELRDQVLYTRSLSDGDLQPSEWVPTISLPRMDFNALTSEQLMTMVRGYTLLNIAGQTLKLGVNTCPFIMKGSASIRWDGEASPCLPLMHSHESYLDVTLRKTQAVSYGNVNKQSLMDIWNNPEYVGLRERLQEFDFSPCTFCNSCEMAESNKEDCFGNIQPTCGGCLWAQGFIQCP